MATLIQEFEAAAREIEALLAPTSVTPLSAGGAQATPQWINAANVLLQRTGRLLASAQPQMLNLRSTPEIQHLRKVLKSLRDVIETSQERLLSQRTVLEDEREHQKRLRAWASAVSKIV